MSFPRLNISASAGSGKTFALSTHYIAMLLRGAPPESIFASTFTRKAASEILDRVLIRIAAAARSDQVCRELSEHIHQATAYDPKLTPAAAEDLLADLMRQLHRLGISTLDSFFVKTATCFSLELTLPPGWRIASEVHQQQLAAEAVDELLREAEANDPQAMVELVRQLNRGGANRSVHETLLSLFRSLHPVYQETAATGPEAWESEILLPCEPLGDKELETAIGALTHCELPASKSGAPDGRFIKAIKPIVDDARRGDWQSLLGQSLAGKLLANDCTHYNRPFTESLKAALRTLVKHARAVVAQQITEERAALHRLLGDYDRHYRALQGRRRAYRFDDVTRSLANAEHLPKQREIAYRLDARIQHLLLDEFQDTSLPQWRALEPVASEVLSYGDGSRAALIVADPKQSIYGWRGGEPELVHAIGKLYDLTSDTLKKSYRSSAVVLDTVNRVCEALPDVPALKGHERVVEDWMRAYSPHEAAFEIPGHARVHVAPAADKPPQQAQLTIRHAARIVRDLHEAAPGRTIGVLMRTNKAVRRMIHQLRQSDINVHASEEGGNPLTDSAAVCAVLALLKLADHPSDTIARFHVAATPLGAVVGLTDHADQATARRVANDIRHRLLVDGYGPTLHWLTQHLAPHCDRRDLARLLQLVELGCSYEADAVIRTRDFVTLVETTRVEDVTAADVRVMTVHQSKGLEFDIVVLPELDIAPISSQPPALMVYREHPVSPISAVVPGARTAVREALPEVFEQMHEAHQYQQMRDALSTLYVALTRAKHAVHMVIGPTSQKKTDSSPLTFATILRQALTDDAPADPEDDHYYSSGDPDWHAAAAPPAGTAAAEEKRPIARDRPLLAASAASRDRALPRRSPSSMHDDRKVDLNDVLRLDDGRARAFGSAVHSLCELIEWADDLPDAATLRQGLARFDVDDPDQTVEAFVEMVREPEIAAALSREAYPAGAHVTVRREHPFAVRLDHTLVNGLFDRLVLTADAADPSRITAADILDFKTDRIDAGDEAALADVAERYRPQLETYRRAAARLYGLETNRITARLLLLRPGRVVSV